ncbi:MAG: cell division protein FtsZ [Bacteroidales bacterium]|nr:cell division protein FtsZ [Bacteroidales bacterium]
MPEDINIIIAPKDWPTADNIIKVLGVGGGGCNAVNYMYNRHIQGCSFVVCNTDAQALGRCDVPMKIQLGLGLGAGTNPTKGRNAALESQDEIAQKILDPNTKMLFITAGMGGGTGTGATPVIAKMAKDQGILTVGVVTLPFRNEGREVLARAIDGIHELEKNVDSLIIINNEKLYQYFGDELIQDAFPKADEVLATAVRSIIEIIKKPGYINVDFEDVQTMMRGSGMALMGCGTGSGPNRIDDAVKQAFESPLLNDYDLKTAKNVLVNISAGNNQQGLKMSQLGEINNKIAEYTGGKNNFKNGLIWDDDPEIGDSIHITAIATGFKLGAILGPDIDLGSIISIDSDYVYDKSSGAAGEALPLDEITTHIGFSTTVKPKFDYNPEAVPALLTDNEATIREYEEKAAIRRIQQ